MLYLSQSQQMTTRDLVFSALDVVRKIYTMSMLMTCSQLVGYFQSCFTDSLSCLVHGRWWKGGDLCHLASDLHPFYDPEDYKRRREVELKHGRVRGPGIVPTVILGVSQNEGDSKSPSKWFSAVGNQMDLGQWQPLKMMNPSGPRFAHQVWWDS